MRWRLVAVSASLSKGGGAACRLVWLAMCAPELQGCTTARCVLFWRPIVKEPGEAAGRPQALMFSFIPSIKPNLGDFFSPLGADPAAGKCGDPKCVGGSPRIHSRSFPDHAWINETAPASVVGVQGPRGLHAVPLSQPNPLRPPVSIVSPRDVDGAAEVHAVGAGSTPPQPARRSCI